MRSADILPVYSALPQLQVRAALAPAWVVQSQRLIRMMIRVKVLKGQEQTGFDCFASVFAEGFRPDDTPVAGAKR